MNGNCPVGFKSLISFENIYCLSNPQDERIFKKSDESEKVNDVVFCGSLHLEERTSILRKLLDNKINVRIAGGRWPAENTFENFEDYANEFKKAKISLNFAASPYCRYQRKGRIAESMACGALCITTYADVLKNRTGTWFEIGKHLVEFNLENCVSVVNHYLKNDEERIKIANEGYKHWKETCSADVFGLNYLKLQVLSDAKSLNYWWRWISWLCPYRSSFIQRL